MRRWLLIALYAACLFLTGPFLPARAEAVDDGMAAISEQAVSEHQEGESVPAGEHEGKKKGLPQFDPSSFPSQIFWLAITFAILYTVFSRKTLPTIGAVLQSRSAHIDDNINRAQRLRENAETAKLRYEQAVAEAQEKSTKLYLKAAEEAKVKTNAGLEEFKARSGRQIQDTEDYIQKAKKEAMESIHSVAAEIASLAAEKIVGISTDIDQAKNVVRNINKKAA